MGSCLLTTMRPAYLPALEFFWNVAQCDVLILTDQIQYVKRSEISVSAPLKNEDDRLRLPVRRRPHPAPIYQKELDSGINWASKHYRTIYHSYHDLPYAYYYLPRIERLYTRDRSSLMNFLHDTLQTLLEFMRLNVRLYRASAFNRFKDNASFIAGVMNATGANGYINERQVFRMGWIDTAALQNRSLPVKIFKDYPDSHFLQSYRSTSALHFILQLGPEAGYLLRRYLPACD